jgi:hypothetical protein
MEHDYRIDRLSARLRAAICAALTFTAWDGAYARDPGAPESYPPGLTFGTPVAAPRPSGFYVDSYTSYVWGDHVDNNGNKTGTSSSSVSQSFQFTYSFDQTFLGARAKMFAAIPLVSVNLKTPGGSFSGSGMANPVLQPLDLTWMIAPGLFVNPGLGFYAPIGTYDKTAAVSTGNEFWTIQPNLALTYLDDGWNASVHMLYDFNTKNTDTGYTSGQEFIVNAWVTKDIAGWSVGPVGYAVIQTTSDKNEGGLPTYGGQVFGKKQIMGLGATLDHRFGPVDAKLFAVGEFGGKNADQGGRVQMTLIYKF